MTVDIEAATALCPALFTRSRICLSEGSKRSQATGSAVSKWAKASLMRKQKGPNVTTKKKPQAEPVHHPLPFIRCGVVGTGAMAQISVLEKRAQTRLDPGSGGSDLGEGKRHAFDIQILVAFGPGVRLA